MEDCREIQWNGLKGLLSGMVLGILSCDVFERRTSTGSEPFPILIGFNVTKFVLPSVFTLSETIWPKMCSKSRLKSAKSLLPADVRGSKTSLLKLPIYEPLTSPFYALSSPWRGGKGGHAHECYLAFTWCQSVFSSLPPPPVLDHSFINVLLFDAD